MHRPGGPLLHFRAGTGVGDFLIVLVVLIRWCTQCFGACSCGAVLPKAAYHTIRPGALPEVLAESGLDEAHAQVLAEVWQRRASELIAKLKENSMVRSPLPHKILFLFGNLPLSASPSSSPPSFARADRLLSEVPSTAFTW